MNRKMMREDDDVENIGIMKGFMDSMVADEEDEGDEDSGESAAMMMERRPNSPEILMNNLRGDMRSIDARRDELADLVGYQAATETPEQVLAMLQPILAQQGGGGIGALPQSQPMAQGPQAPMMGGAPGMPPPGMPPMPPDAGMPPPPEQGGIAELMAGLGGGAPGMPPPPPGAGMPPMPPGGGAPMPPPMGMARGGYVQNFQVGTDEDGVTPADEPVPAEPDLTQYSPDLVAAAKRASMDLFNRKATAAPTLSGAMLARLPEYTKLLGPDKDASQAQLLFDLGQRAFGFAANRDDAGRPLTGSFLSRLAGATQTLPAAMGKRIDEIAKIDRQLKVLALQQGEKDIDQVTAQNSDLQKRKGELMNQVLTAQGKVDAADVAGKARVEAAAKKAAGVKPPGPFGTSREGLQLQMISEYAPLYAAGSLLPQQVRDFLIQVEDYTKERRTRYTDPESGLLKEEIQKNKLPAFVMEALGNMAPKPSTTTSSGGSAASVSRPAPGGAASGAQSAPSLGLTPNDSNPEIYQVASTSPRSTFFDLAGFGTGFVPVLVAGVARNVPLDAAGQIRSDFQQATSMITDMSNRIVNVLQESPRFAETERAMIKEDLNISPELFTNKSAFINRVIALDNSFEKIEEKTYKIFNDVKTGITFRNDAAKKLQEIDSVREMLGIRSRTFLPIAPDYNSDEDRKKWAALPPGQYIVLSPQGFKVIREKKPAAKR